MTKKSAARRYDIAGMVDLLSYLFENTPHYVTEVIKKTNIPRDTFYTALDILIEDGLVVKERKKGPHQRYRGRMKTVNLTERGKRIAKCAYEYRKALEEVWTN